MSVIEPAPEFLPTEALKALEEAVLKLLLPQKYWLAGMVISAIIIPEGETKSHTVVIPILANGAGLKEEGNTVIALLEEALDATQARIELEKAHPSIAVGVSDGERIGKKKS